jgi:hypothetical protein
MYEHESWDIYTSSVMQVGKPLKKRDGHLRSVTRSKWENISWYQASCLVVSFAMDRDGMDMCRDGEIVHTRLSSFFFAMDPFVQG